VFIHGTRDGNNQRESTHDDTDHPFLDPGQRRPLRQPTPPVPADQSSRVARYMRQIIDVDGLRDANSHAWYRRHTSHRTACASCGARKHRREARTLCPTSLQEMLAEHAEHPYLGLAEELVLAAELERAERFGLLAYGAGHPRPARHHGRRRQLTVTA
jgi:hypothetical protein